MSLNPSWTSLERMKSLSPGRRGPGAYWFYYNPWARRADTADELRAYCASHNRLIPDGDPRGWNHTPAPDVWAPNLVAGSSIAIVGGWNSDVPVRNNNGVHDHDENEEAAAIPVASVTCRNGDKSYGSCQ